MKRASQGDDVDVQCAQYFVNSSLAPVVFFRRRLKSLADVLRGTRIRVLLSPGGYWGAVCRHGPCGPISSLDPWDRWIPPDLHCFYRWVFDFLEVLNGFLKDLMPGLDRTMILLLLFLDINDHQTQSSQILVEPHLIDAEFRQAWMPGFTGR